MEQNPGDSKKPNFFIVGAAKAGTTSLYHYLSQHPEIYLSPNKEPQFFADKAHKPPHNGPGDDKYDWRRIKSWEDYNRLFKGVENEKVIGEASTSYLYYHKIAAPLIYKSNPNSKILIMLRNPADRAFSAYRHMLRDKRETLSFEDAIKSEEKRKKENYTGLWFYTDVGYYHLQVMEYLNTFNKGVKIFLYEDFDNNPDKLLRDILKFLEVNEHFNLDSSIKHNTSHINIFSPLNEFLNNDNHPLKKLLRPVLFNTLGEKNTAKIVDYVRDKTSIDMKPETRKYLKNLYRDDILKLQNLIDRDLSRWL